MGKLKTICTCGVICGLLFLLQALQVSATAPASVSAARPHLAPSTSYESQAFAFDWAWGVWKTQIQLRLHPLTGSKIWVQYQGTTIDRQVWYGRADLAQLEADGPEGHIELLSLRLYNPKTQQWSLNVANSRIGILDTPTVGQFKNGRGEFYDKETYNGKPIVVRFVISNITPTSARYVQAFSGDDGKTWETNWIATDTRVGAVNHRWRW